MPNPQVPKPVLRTRKHIARLERERNQTRLILAGFIGIVVLVLGLLVYGYVDIKYLQVRRPVARVSNVEIPVGEWQARVRMERGRLINQFQLYQQYEQYFGMDVSSQQQQTLAQLQSTSTLGQTVIDQMIDEELVRQESAKRGITAIDQEVQSAIEAGFEYYPSGTPTPSITPTPVSSPTLSPETLAIVTITPTPTAFVTPTASPTSSPDPLASPTTTASPTVSPTAGPSPTLEPSPTVLPSATPYTQQGFEEAYARSLENLTKIGLTESQVRRLYTANVLREKLVAEITADLPRTQEQVWARHILVTDEAVAKTIQERLNNDEDFAKIAAEASIDTANKLSGGDLGWFGKGVMVPEFETAAFNLKIGEISNPVKTQFGYHLIQVLAHADVPLNANGYEEARQQAFREWLIDAREIYKVQTYNIWQNIVPTDPPIPALPQ